MTFMSTMSAYKPLTPTVDIASRAVQTGFSQCAADIALISEKDSED